MPQSIQSYYEDFYPRGIRKMVAISIICLTTMVPAVIVWKDGGEPAPQPHPGIRPRFGNRPLGGNQAPQPAAASRLPIFRTMLAVLGGFLGLALYYPRSGFKRYALLSGPLSGIGSLFVIGEYLAGRTTVYRFEIVFASLIGALPGVILYVILTRRKWHKKHSSDSLWIE
jgi:hypothetical protein